MSKDSNIKPSSPRKSSNISSSNKEIRNGSGYKDNSNLESIFKKTNK